MGYRNPNLLEATVYLQDEAVDHLVLAELLVRLEVARLEAVFFFSATVIFRELRAACFHRKKVTRKNTQDKRQI